MSGILLILLLLVLSGVPLFVVIGGITLVCFAFYPQVGSENFLNDFEAFVRNFNVMEKMVALADEPTLVAIPFFMIAGAIMTRGVIARRLVGLAEALFGWLPGGMAISAVSACMLFAAISGSSPVTVITIGAIMLPALHAAGYKENFSLGLVTSAGSLGIVIPPSIPMIIYAIFASSAGASVNIENLFIAGIGPGLLIGACLAFYCVLIGRHAPREKFSAAKLVAALKDGFWSLMLPLFVLGGIYTGVFNATQASAISVIVAFVIEWFVHKELKMEDLPDLLRESATLMGSILIIIALAFGFSEFLTFQELPEKLQALLVEWELSPIAFALVLNLMLLVIGCLMDIISAIILFVPLITPIALELGFDPLHLGLIFIVNLEIGYLTPPLGLNLFVAAGYFNKSFGQVVRSVVPFIGMMMVALVVITYVPWVSLQFVALRDENAVRMEFPTGAPVERAPGTQEKSVQEIMQQIDEAPAPKNSGSEEEGYDDYGYGLDEGEDEGNTNGEMDPIPPIEPSAQGSDGDEPSEINSDVGPIPEGENPSKIQK
ncbi:MAG: TRAP transporter large permease subunit [Myxococcales bacterium]|nr:TRAP transporter large permease subunit [Myxococcales bacterium]